MSGAEFLKKQSKAYSRLLLAKIDLLDQRISRWLTARIFSSLAAFLRVVTLMGEGKSWLVMGLLLSALSAKGWLPIPAAKGFFSSTAAAGLAWGFSTLIKKVSKRPRPFQTLERLKHLKVDMRDDSMPSSHAATSFAFFIALLLISHPLAWWIGVWALLVAFSRLYLGVHYLSDILVGMMIGLLCAYLKVFAFHSLLG